MIPFEGGGAFLPKRTTGAIGENRKIDPSSFLGSGPSSCYRKRKWNHKNLVKSKGENNGQTVIPLLQGFHTQCEFVAALGPRLSGKHESSTSTTNPRSQWPMK
jgi:hypothetical protein